MSVAGDMRGIADRCRGYGLRVLAMPGWERRSRGPINPSYVVCHHTAASRDVDALLRDGRADLAGPLCNFALHADGTVVLVAAGRANHAGVSRITNAQSYGIEATGPPFPNYDAYVRLVAAIRAHHQWGSDRVLGHKEICHPRGRKIDPTFDMGTFRSRVSTLHAARPAPLLVKGDGSKAQLPGPTRPPAAHHAQGEDMFNEQDRKRLQRIEERLAALVEPGVPRSLRERMDDIERGEITRDAQIRQALAEISKKLP